MAKGKKINPNLSGGYVGEKEIKSAGNKIYKIIHSPDAQNLGKAALLSLITVAIGSTIKSGIDKSKSGAESAYEPAVGARQCSVGRPGSIVFSAVLLSTAPTPTKMACFPSRRGGVPKPSCWDPWLPFCVLLPPLPPSKTRHGRLKLGWRPCFLCSKTFFRPWSGWKKRRRNYGNNWDFPRFLTTTFRGRSS